MFDKNNYKIDNTFIDINAIKRSATNDRCIVYTVPIKYQYRPDLIAYSLYRDVTMQDYITIINNIIDSPEGYYTGRKIKVLKPQYKENV